MYAWPAYPSTVADTFSFGVGFVQFSDGKWSSQMAIHVLNNCFSSVQPRSKWVPAYSRPSIVLPLLGEPSSCNSYQFATLVLAPFANLWFVCVEQIFELGDVLEKYFPDLILVRFRHISCFSISSLHTVMMKQHPQSLIPLASQLVKIWDHWLYERPFPPLIFLVPGRACEDFG